MPFFTPLPEPEDDSEEEQKPRYFHLPGQRPQHWVPGTGPAGALLARSSTTAVVLHLTGAYPDGLAATLQVLMHPEHADDGPWRPGRRRSGWGGLRLGMQWADGRRVEADPWHHPGHDRVPDAFRLSWAGGGGGGLEWLATLWLHPLPPPEPVDVYVEWLRRGIPETRTVVDLAPAVGWAADAVELWPLPGPPEDAGWFAYRPM